MLWMVLHAEALYASQHGGIRFTLTTLFAILILCRPKPKTETGHTRQRPPGALRLAAGGLGAAAVMAGLILPIRQLEWIGLLMVAYACLATGLPDKATRDVPPALLVLYWANPLPSRLFFLLQSSMQTVSVRGAEWFLHLINVRVWAEGMLLRTGTRLFEVPAWCSGMRAATTVFILSLALGILRRFPPPGIAVLIGWSLLHALVLNVLRIAAMVYFAPMMQDDQGLAFLHDTGGVLMIAAVFLVYIEVLLLEHFRRRRRQHHATLKAVHEGGLSEYPPFWHRFLRRRHAGAGILVLLAAVSIIAWRSRPYHRTRMLQDVALNLRDAGDPATARRLAAKLVERLPDDLDWRFTAIRLELVAGDAQAVLDALAPMADIATDYQLQRDILQAYAHLRIGNLEEAARLVEALPETTRTTDPRVAMILAEMALRRDQPDAVTAHVAAASRWAPNAGRIRNLYPYLRIHRKWDAMAATDITVPYHDAAQAFSMLEALMNLNRVPRVAAITLEAMTHWPQDARVLEPLFFMALKRGGEWEARFSEHLRRALPTLQAPEALYELLYKCFHLARPDLAWHVYRHLEQEFPDHPVLAMSLVEYGHRWFVFRRHHLGMQAASDTDTIDLKPLFVLGNLLPAWQPLTQRVPRGHALAAADVTPVRREALQTAINAFRDLERRDALSLDLHYLYAQALERHGRLDLARGQLETLVQRHPGETAAARALLSEMYERKGAWVQVYETLRPFITGDRPIATAPPDATPDWPPEKVSTPDDDRLHLRPLLRLTRAQLELRLHLAALFTARETLRRYPYSPQAKVLLATALMRTDAPEAALQLLSRPRVRGLRELDLLEAEALYATERFGEMTAFCRRRQLPSIPIPPGTPQHTVLPPAELSVLWHRAYLPAEHEFAATAQQLQANLAGAGDGLAPLFSLWLEAYHGEQDALALDRWQGLGRDRLEQAIALNQLTLLLCREARFAEALPAAQAAVAALPDSPRLWKILISLAGGDPGLVATARQFCPEDADLWLADLVMSTRPGGTLPQTPADWQAVHARLALLLDEALADHGASFPADAMTRAADYLWRGGLQDEADRLIPTITATARGLLPAYILGIRNALREQDKHLALLNTERAIAAAIAPMPALHENLVRLKSGEGEMDVDTGMLHALRQLRKSDPDNPRWAQMLGYLRFKRGGWEIVDALFEMNTAIAGGATNQTPFLMAAETARLLRNDERAADILRRGLEHHPGNPVFINNLAYTLARREETVPHALALLPALAEAADNDPRIHDTIAVVHLRAGNLETARQTLVRILQTVEPGSPIWFRAQMHLAEITWRQGGTQTAISMLEQLLRGSRGIPDAHILAANALLSRITSEIRPMD